MQLLQHTQRLDAVSNPHSGVPLEAVCGTLQALLETLLDPELLHLPDFAVGVVANELILDPSAGRLHPLFPRFATFSVQLVKRGTKLDIDLLAERWEVLVLVALDVAKNQISQLGKVLERDVFQRERGWLSACNHAKWPHACTQQNTQDTTICI